MCTSEDFVTEELLLRWLSAIVCVRVGVLVVLPWWDGDVVRCGARVFFFKVGSECGEYGVRVCCDFVCCGVPDCL